MKRIISEYGKPILFAFLAAILITSIARPTLVREYSMYPTITPYSYIIVTKIPYLFSMPSYNDIIVFNSNIVTEHNEGRRLVKRVIGIGGDVIEIRDGNVYLNGELLEEDYIDKDSYTHVYDDESIWEVPEGSIFVLGDNRSEGASKDSRYFGCISVKTIKGITGFRYFPINKRFGKIH